MQTESLRWKKWMVGNGELIKLLEMRSIVNHDNCNSRAVNIRKAFVRGMPVATPVLSCSLLSAIVHHWNVDGN